MALFTNEDKFNHIILAAAQNTGLPYSLIKAVVAAESGYNQNAKREEPDIKDASYGLMQILYRTAQSVGYTGTAGDLLKPENSVQYGAQYLAGLRKKYSDIGDVIASYNMGRPRLITETTKYIAELYKYPYEYRQNAPVGWIYANQPYVDRVKAYLAYYQAKERNDQATAGAVEQLVRAGKHAEAAQYARNLDSLSPDIAKIVYVTGGLALAVIVILALSQD